MMLSIMTQMNGVLLLNITHSISNVSMVHASTIALRDMLRRHAKVFMLRFLYYDTHYVCIISHTTVFEQWNIHTVVRKLLWKLRS